MEKPAPHNIQTQTCIYYIYNNILFVIIYKPIIIITTLNPNQLISIKTYIISVVRFPRVDLRLSF